MKRLTLVAALATALLYTSSAAADSHAESPMAAPLSADESAVGGSSAGDFHNDLRVGAFAGWNFLDDDLELGNSFFEDQVPEPAALLGLRVGLDFLRLMPTSVLAPVLGVELEGKLAFSELAGAADGSRPDDLAPVFGWRAHAMATFLSNLRAQPFLVVGAGGETVFTSSDFVDSPDTDAAFHWGAGARYMVTSNLGVRLDYRMVITAGRIDYRSYNHELHVGVGYGFDLFGGEPAAPPPPPAPVDEDGDGFVGTADTCPTEPEDVDGHEDQDGCPDTDNDGDGIADGDDECPMEAETVNDVDDADGCPESDDDGDGLFGSADSCPEEPEDKDGHQDEDGCPDNDNDGDGIADSSDKCPAAAETSNGYKDEDGCPDEVPKAVKKFTGTIKGIRFASGSSRIVRSSNRVLNQAVKILGDYPEIRIEIAGHTDDTGPLDKNMALSKARAESVKQYLVNKGIEADRIEAKGYGPDQPVASNDTVRGRAKNRRIEFRLISQSGRKGANMDILDQKPKDKKPAPKKSDGSSPPN